MTRNPRKAISPAITSFAALAALTAAAVMVPLAASDAGATTAYQVTARAGVKCKHLKSQKARKQCRKESRVTATPTAKPTTKTTVRPSATAMPTSSPTVAPPSRSAAATGSPSASSPSASVTASPTAALVPQSLVDLIATLGGYGVVPRQPATGIFSPFSEWNRDIRSAPVAADSAGLVANLAQQVATRYGGVAAFNVGQYNVSAYSVGPNVARSDVKWDNCQHKTYVPAAIYTVAQGAHFASVPIPPDAVPATGTDGELTIYSPATDQLWEFWKANKQSDGWHACWGGRIDNVSTNKGWFPSGMGVGATGLTAVGGAIGISEAQALRINHAMSIGIPQAANWSTFSYPAQRSDGNMPTGTASAIQEGQRFRLDPSVDVSKLSLTPLARAVAVAAQRYGFVVDNVAGAVGVVTESGNGTVASSGVNPWNSILNGTPSYLMMKNFPWDKLQALPLNYGK